MLLPLYAERVVHMDKRATDAALAEIAKETELGISQAIDVVADRAKGVSVTEVERMLRAELSQRGIDLADTMSIAQQIVVALNPKI